MMKTKPVIVAALFLASAVVVPPHALAISGKTKVVARGQEAKAIPGWPEGVLELINHPVRVNGWHPWFSECPNDGYYYEMDVRRPQDVNELIKILAAIKAKTVQLNLDPADGAPHAEGMGAIFSLGNQSIINRWFQDLPEVEPGIRQFGAHRYRQPPTALPPTLTLYVGHKAVNLNRLAIPANVDVTAPNPKSYRAKHADTFKVIDEFVESRKAKQEASGKMQTDKK